MPFSMDAAAITLAINNAWRLREAMGRERRIEWHPQAAFRIANGSGDGLPGLAIDRYGSFAFLHIYGNDWQPRLSSVHAALLALPGIAGVYQTDRTRTNHGHEIHEGFAAGIRAPGDGTTVVEGGLQYEIQLAAGPAVGLYLDQRDNRKRVAEMTASGSLLNTFSYTCSFSLVAAKQGAKTLSIDLGKAPLASAKRNFDKNGLTSENHRFLAEDVFIYLPRLARKGEQFTGVLLDPPTFARGKKGTFSTEKNYAELVALAAPLVAPGGYLIAFANTHRMSNAAWQGEVLRGLGASGAEFQEYAQWSQASDFRADRNEPAENYLKSLVLLRK